jgi:hypothetical protein
MILKFFGLSDSAQMVTGLCNNANPEFKFFDAPVVIDNTTKQVIDSAA